MDPRKAKAAAPAKVKADTPAAGKAKPTWAYTTTGSKQKGGKKAAASVKAASAARRRVPVAEPYEEAAPGEDDASMMKEGSAPVDLGRQIDPQMLLLEIPEGVACTLAVSTCTHDERYLSTQPIVSSKGTVVPGCINARPLAKGELRQRCVAFAVQPPPREASVLPMFLTPAEHLRFMTTGQLPYDSANKSVLQGQCLLCWRSDATMVFHHKRFLGFTPQNVKQPPFCNLVDQPKGYRNECVVEVTPVNQVARFDPSALQWCEHPITRAPFVSQAAMVWTESAAPQDF